MNILILDDESHARISVKSYLERFLDTEYTVWEAVDISEALDATKEAEIDLAFLDIHLNSGTSFDFLAHFEEISFKIIFISGHDEYAIKAFRFNAVDYILKPIAPREFEEAIEKIMEAIPLSVGQLDSLTADINADVIEKIVLKDLQSVYFVPIKDIIYCQSENNYTTFLLLDGSEITISKTLKGYEDMLRPLHFFRTHRSFLINLKLVRSFDKKEGGSIIMTNGSAIPLARNKRDTFIKLMKIS
ncbi:MAG: LytTR family DNA-binding domain-containing protein [Bacteroidota bacterium]